MPEKSQGTPNYEEHDAATAEQLNQRVKVLESVLGRTGRWVAEPAVTESHGLNDARGTHVYTATDGSRWFWTPDASRLSASALLEIERTLRHRMVDAERACEIGLLLLDQLQPR